MALILFCRGLQALAEPFITVEFPFEDDFRCFSIENHEVQKLIFVEVGLKFVFSDRLIFRLNVFLEISIEVNEDGVAFLFGC